MKCTCVYMLLILTILTGSATACPDFGRHGQFVKLTFIDQLEQPISNANVSASIIPFHTYWWWDIIGTISKSNVVLVPQLDIEKTPPQYAQTDNNGVVILTLYDTIEYNLTITKGDIIKTWYLIPHNVNDYIFVVT